MVGSTVTRNEICKKICPIVIRNGTSLPGMRLVRKADDSRLGHSASVAILLSNLFRNPDFKRCLIYEMWLPSARVHENMKQSPAWSRLFTRPVVFQVGVLDPIYVTEALVNVTSSGETPVPDSYYHVTRLQ